MNKIPANIRPFEVRTAILAAAYEAMQACDFDPTKAIEWLNKDIDDVWENVFLSIDKRLNGDGTCAGCKTDTQDGATPEGAGAYDLCEHAVEELILVQSAADYLKTCQEQHKVVSKGYYPAISRAASITAMAHATGDWSWALAQMVKTVGDIEDIKFIEGKAAIEDPDMMLNFILQQLNEQANKIEAEDADYDLDEDEEEGE